MKSDLPGDRLYGVDSSVEAARAELSLSHGYATVSGRGSMTLVDSWHCNRVTAGAQHNNDALHFIDDSGGSN